MSDNLTDEQERARYDSLDDQIYQVLMAISSIDVNDMNLRDHPDAYELMHKFADQLQSEAYAEGRADEAAYRK